MTDQPSTSSTPASSPVHPDPTVRQQVSAYASGSVANMLRSMLVIAAIMALFIIMFPRIQPDHSGVDVIETARQIRDSTGIEITAPTELPDGWTAMTAQYRRSADGLMTWHAVFETPTGEHVALNEAVDATDAWVSEQVNRTERTGQVDLLGVTWQQYERGGSNPQRSFVDRGGAGELTTVVTGSASWEELQIFVESLAPIAGTTAVTTTS